jgi:serine/threonine-protein kinase
VAQDTLERIKLALQDRYLIERELGRGGMATVYLGHDGRHDREVAIKVLHPELAASIGSERFEREIRLAAKLQHPHILGLYDSGVADGLFYYVMPFVKGESLRDRLDREGQLPIDDAVQFTLEVADALGLAHSLGIVHRDIKPENVLLSNGHALVADFGIARAASEGEGQKLTQTGMALGTPVYMAPEQAMGQVVGPTADIYSMGCMLYEMLAGEPPFTGKSPQAIMARHAMENVPSIRIVRSAVPEEVEDAIFAAMAKTPADRPQTAAKFAEFFGVPMGSTATRRSMLRHTASRRVPTGTHLPAFTATDPDHALPPLWKRPPVLAVAAGFLVLAGFGAWRLVGNKPPPAASLDPAIKRVAVLYFADNSPDHRLRPVADGLTEALIKALSQVRTLTVVSRNGVEPFRGTDVPPDSVARAVKAGTLVTGSVEPQGKDKIRVTTMLRDGSGADVGKRSNFVVAANQVFAAEDSVAQEVARTLRSWLGQEVQLRERQAGTNNAAAWNLLRRAEGRHKDAKTAVDTDRAQAAVLYAETDSLLQQAESADAGWIDPIVLRGELAYEQLGFERDPKARAPLVDRGLATAARALAIDGNNAKALALRGQLEFAQWQLGLITDQNARAELLKQAKADLESAIRTDPSLASAYAALSVIDYSETPADVFSALRDARAAYEADAYLSNSDYILTRLFWTSYDTEAFAEAAKWCDEGRRRFPRDARFVNCQLWLLLNPSPPDIDLAWKLAKQIDSLAPPATRQYQSHLARIIVGGVIGRAAKAAKTASAPNAKSLADSADRVLVAARGDATVDPEHELPGYEAIMRVQLGDIDGAIRLLKQYVAVNPDHSFEVAGNVHWWWRDLRSNPGFEALLSRRK